jgi:hypothetical protein
MEIQLAQKCIKGKLKNGITTLRLLDNWICGDNTQKINELKNISTNSPQKDNTL